MHELEYGLRASLVAFYRALRQRGRAAGEELERLLRGDGPHGRSARLAGRLIRVLAELELVSLDRDLPALAIAGAAPTALDRSPVVQGLRQAIRGRQAIPEQRKPTAKRLTRHGATGRADGGLAGAEPGAVLAAASGRRAVAGRVVRRRLAARAPVGTPSSGGGTTAQVDDRPSRAHRLRARTARRSVRDRRGARRSAARCRSTATASRRRSSTPATHHADQRRQSGEDFIIHPVGVAKICAGMRLDTETLCAALLHDTVEDTSASLEEVSSRFGAEIAGLVDGVTKLTGLTFQSRDEAQAENYRKMMVAMASDIRVILIKLADRLHNMRTISAMPKQKQIEKSRETLDIYAPIAHRLGIHAIKWELEDLAFQTLHPAQVQRDQGARRPAARRARALRQRGRRVPRPGAEGARDRRRDLRARQALLLDLLEDDQEGSGVQRDLRPHRDAGDRRLRSRTPTARSA